MAEALTKSEPGNMKPNDARSLHPLLTCLIFAISGAVSGCIAIGAWILSDFVWDMANAAGAGAYDAHMHHWSPMRRLFWDVLETEVSRWWMLGAIGGAVIGALMPVFSERSRRLVPTTVLWASVFGTLGLAMVYFLQHPRDSVLMVEAVFGYLVAGAVYGFLLSAVANVMRAGVLALQRRLTQGEPSV